MKILFITSNKDKFEEVEEFFGKNIPYINIEQIHFDFEEPRSESIEYISMRKVLEYYNSLRQNYREEAILTEDSGLFIKSLNNFPGAYTATIYNKIGLEGILNLLQDQEDRRAYYKACFSLLIHSPMEIKTFTGIVRGEISEKIRGGESYFGQDPIFIPEGHKQTFAENYDLKRKLSHRIKALEKLKDYLISLEYY